MDAAPIQHLAARRDRHENRRVTVLDRTDDRSLPRSCSRHRFLFRSVLRPVPSLSRNAAGLGREDDSHERRDKTATATEIEIPVAAVRLPD